MTSPADTPTTGPSTYNLVRDLGFSGAFLTILTYIPSILSAYKDTVTAQINQVAEIKATSDKKFDEFVTKSDARYAAIATQFADIAASLKATAAAAAAAKDEAKAARTESKLIGNELKRDVAKVQKSVEAGDG